MITFAFIVMAVFSVYVGYRLGKNEAIANSYFLGFKHGYHKETKIIEKLDRQFLKDNGITILE